MWCICSNFLVGYRSSFLLLTNNLNLFNLSILYSINFRLHKSLHDSRESEGRIPLQILNFKSQLKSQVNAIRATTIIFMVERYYRWPQRSSLRSIERNVLNHWREICPWYFHRNNFCSSSNTPFKAGFENTLLSSVSENWLLDVDGDPWIYMEHVNAFS